jgi:hypothetical protein
MRDPETPPPSASMDHFRTEVGRRAARQAQRHRRLLGGRIALVVVLALGVSLLIVKPGAHTGTRASSPTPAPLRSGTGRPGPAGATSASNVPHFSPRTTTGNGNGCPPDSVCLDGPALETGSDRPEAPNAATSPAPGPPENRSAGTAAIRSASLPGGGVLRFSLRSSATEHWGIPRVVSGTALKRRAAASGADRTTTTEFVPAARSGTATVSIVCAGTGCDSPSYRVQVDVVP